MTTSFARWRESQAPEQRDLAYLALNPAGKVPTLVDHTSTPALVINQSNAIIQFSDAKAPGRLAPAHPGPERDRVFDRYFFFVTDVIGPSHAAFFLRQAGLIDAATVIDLRVIEQLVYAERFLTGDFADLTVCAKELDDSCTNVETTLAEASLFNAERKCHAQKNATH